MKTRGFTLIELLIVVAIIAILAAIAVPNFLEAQTRSKVSRSKADMRSLATAIEAYIVDNNTPSSDAGNGAVTGGYRAYDQWDDGTLNFSVQPQANFTLGFELTTPIAYISSITALVDPFKLSDGPPSFALSGRQYYGFMSWSWRQRVTGTSFATQIDRNGNWVLVGAGPDRYVNNRPGGNSNYSNATSIPRGVNYDPTNGTVSNGDIYFTQKFGGNGGWTRVDPIPGD